MDKTFPGVCRLCEEIAAKINCLRLTGNNIIDAKGSVRRKILVH
jgi:hypothetical protein